MSTHTPSHTPGQPLPLPGHARNKPCACGSGVKAKKCPCRELVLQARTEARRVLEAEFDRRLATYADRREAAAEVLESYVAARAARGG